MTGPLFATVVYAVLVAVWGRGGGHRRRRRGAAAGAFKRDGRHVQVSAVANRELEEKERSRWGA